MKKYILLTLVTVASCSTAQEVNWSQVAEVEHNPQGWLDNLEALHQYQENSSRSSKEEQSQIQKIWNQDNAAFWAFLNVLRESSAELQWEINNFQQQMQWQQRELPQLGQAQFESRQNQEQFQQLRQENENLDAEISVLKSLKNQPVGQKRMSERQQLIEKFNAMMKGKTSTRHPRER